MYDGFFADLIELVIMCDCICILGFLINCVLGFLINLFRLIVKDNPLFLVDELQRWYLQLKSMRQIPNELELEIHFATRLNDKKTIPILLINVYYSSAPVFNFEEPLKNFLTSRRIKKKVMNIDFKKLTTHAYNVYMEDIIDGLDGIRPD